MKGIPYVFALLLLCLFFFYSPVHATGNTIDLTSSSNYNLRFDGPAANAGIGYNGTLFADVNNNGRNDLIIAAGSADVAGSGYGAVYIIYDSLLDSLNATGTKNFDLSTSSNYTLRIDGISSSIFGYYTKVGNISGDSYNELIVGGGADDTQSRTNNGAIYIFTNAAISGYGTTTGNTFTAADTSKWHYRIDGAASSHRFSRPEISDVNNDGSLDLMGSSNATSYSASLAGSSYILLNSLISGTSTGNTLDLATSSNYTLRIDGSGASAYAALSALPPCDYDGDGLKDVAITNQATLTDRGTTHIIKNSLLNLSSTGNTLNLGTSSNYNVAFLGDSGAYAESIMKGCTDSDNDGKDDLLLLDYVSNSYYVAGSLISSYMNSTGQNLNLTSNYTAKFASLYLEALGDFDFTNDNTSEVFTYSCCSSLTSAEYGSTWMQPKSIYSSLSGTGNSLSINTASNYYVRFDGGSQYTYPRAVGDVNNDGMKDLVFVSDQADFNSKSNSGSVWIVFNYPHTITKSSEERSGNTVTVKGTVSAAYSATSINGVQYQVDSNSPSSGWSSCTADDGSFNSRSESFTCTISSAPENLGNHTVYIRSYDANTSYTAQSYYTTYVYAVGTSGGTSSTSTISKPQIPQLSDGSNGGGIISPVGDSSTGEQKVLTVIEPHTFPFDAFLSSVHTNPTTLKSGAGGKVRVQSGKSSLWQVGNVQQIWYKAYAASSDKAPAKIIPELQKKPSIVALSYTDANLVPPGRPKSKFNAKTLKLAHSVDGITWKILPTSVVDTKNKTVAALHKVGGYYMIVGK